MCLWRWRGRVVECHGRRDGGGRLSNMGVVVGMELLEGMRFYIYYMSNYDVITF